MMAVEDALAGTHPNDEDFALDIVRLNGVVMGVVLGLMAAAFIFLVTNFLVIRGGDPLGPHLALLGQFFYGYSVSFVGSLVGGFYGLILGFFVGWSTSRLYNLIVAWRSR